MKEPKVLHLTLSKKPFEVMVTGEKKEEFRKPSEWIKSRLDGKDYDQIKFVNGYGKDKPYFVAEFDGFFPAWEDEKISYSNGLNVHVKEGDYVIGVGEIIETGNLSTDGRPG